MSPFERDWRKYYGGVQPLSYALRTCDHLNWVRFHSLPAGKRYADNAEEWNVILQRQAILAAEILGAAGSCWLVVTVPEAVAYRLTGKSLPTELEEAYRFQDRDGVYGDEDLIWIVAVAPVTWSVHTFEPLLRDIADDEGPRALWMSRTNGSVFAPYDGGVDPFPVETAQRDDLKMRYADWRSARPDGL
jgi:hypothetical protein